MILGKKFWNINSTGSYSPGANQGVSFGGVGNGTTTITGVPAATVTAIAALTPASNPVGISGQWVQPGTLITAASGTSLTVSKAVGTASGVSLSLTYWDATKPSSAAPDSPIQAVLCLDSAHGTFAFTDEGGRTITIPASTLVKGAVYYWQIAEVTTVSSGDFIGYASI